MRTKKIFSVLLAFIASMNFANVSAEEVTLSIEDVTVAQGDTEVRIPVYLVNNGTTICNFQVDVLMPDGFEIQYEDEEGEIIYSVEKGERAKSAHSVSCALQSDGSLRVILSSTTNATFYESESKKTKPVFYINCSVADDVMGGRHNMTLKNIVLANYTAETDVTLPFYPADETFAITVTPTNETVSVSSLGLATYCPAYAVDFSSAEKIWAYKAAVNGSSVKLTKVSTVAAGEGVLLRALSGGAETEELPTAATTTTAATDNEFVGTLVDSQVYQIDGDKTNYVLSGEATGVGFYKAKLEADGGTTVPAGKAYLPVLTSSLNGANSFSIGWGDDGTTGIVSVKAENNVEAVYTLQGIRVEKPGKGVYIRNGKAILVK